MTSTLQKTNIDTKHDVFLKCISFQMWLFWVSMLVVEGVPSLQLLAIAIWKWMVGRRYFHFFGSAYFQEQSDSFSEGQFMKRINGGGFKRVLWKISEISPNLVFLQFFATSWWERCVSKGWLTKKSNQPPKQNFRRWYWYKVVSGTREWSFFRFQSICHQMCQVATTRYMNRPGIDALDCSHAMGRDTSGVTTCHPFGRVSYNGNLR